MFYETIMQRYGVDENGKDKKFTEKYLTEGLSIVEALTLFETLISGDYPEHETKSIKRTAYTEVITNDCIDCRYFHVTYNTIIPDDNGKDKKTPIAILVQADSFDDAKIAYHEHIRGFVVDVELVKITETKILDYFSTKVA